MTSPLSLALIGFWHVHAQDYAAEAAAHLDTRVVTSWDPDAAFGADCARDLGIDFEPDLDAILGRDDIDGVIITTATTQHDEIITRAIAAGKHVFTEKLLSATVEGAESLIDQAEAAGVALVISLPRLSEPLTATVDRILGSGALGEVNYSRIRLAHDGSVAGWLPDRFYDRTDAIGGALTDLGCHAVYLTQHFMGVWPETVSAVYGRATGYELEDNAVVTLGYSGGRIAVVESSNITVPGASTLEIRGTRGTLVAGFAGLGLMAKGEEFDLESWVALDLDEGLPAPFDAWTRAIRGEGSTEANHRAAVELTRLVVAANSAAEAGRTLAYSAEDRALTS